MNSIMRPQPGLHDGDVEREHQAGRLDGNTTDKSRAREWRRPASVSRREFMNRLDKVLVFRPLGDVELRKILHLELNICSSGFSAHPSHTVLFRVDTGCQDFCCAKDGLEVWSETPEAGYRPRIGESAVEPDCQQSGSRRRLGQRGFRQLDESNGVLQGSRKRSGARRIQADGTNAQRPGAAPRQR